MTRRLEVGQWARTLDSTPDGEIVKLLAVKELIGGYQVWTVQARGQKPVELMAGYLEPLPSAYAP